jgi:hypothetical protein
VVAVPENGNFPLRYKLRAEARVTIQEIKSLGVLQTETCHTIQKCQKMAGQNTFEILLLNDANMIGEH